MAFDPIQLIIYILPAYFANAAPVLFGGGTPIDFNSKWSDGRRLLGAGKSWRGLASGLVFGTLTGLVLSSLFRDPTYALLGMSLSAGAMFGDIFGSFLKRRMGMKQGQPSIILDQLFFVLFAMLAGAWVYVPDAYGIVFILLLTYILHALSNFVANRAGLKRVPW